ncbi:hypothetical protein [Streptomyces bauhiniae]|uniref:hypothetical protein n=1 Tax=Streptomyces bauhiniae TaxID=2340725 RepID=UPI003655E859
MVDFRAGSEVNAMKSRFIPFDERSAEDQDFTHPGCEGPLSERPFWHTAVTSVNAEREVLYY